MLQNYQNNFQQFDEEEPHTSHAHKKSPYLTKKAGALVAALCILASGSIGYAAGVLNTAVPQSVQSGTQTTLPAVSSDSTGASTVAANSGSTGDALSVTEIAARVADSVVEITTESTQYDTFMGQYVSEGAGSGVILSSDGYIVTNNHVIEGASTINVTLRDGTSYPATLVGTDSQGDIAVIKIDATGLKAATFGDSDELVVGEPAIVIGNPLGLEFANTMTQGTISSTSRDIEINNYIMNVIQTDASINPGNSGGPLFNSRGEVVGVVSSKIKTSEAVGIGFAIPSNTALKVANDFIEYGTVQDRPTLGVTVEEINSYYAQMQGLQTGVRVVEVVRGGSADLAGIQAGDYITKFNGEEVTTISELNYAKDQYQVGDTVEVELNRSGQTLTVSLELKDANQLAS